MNSPPDQTTLRDLMRLFGAHRLLFIAVVMVAVGSSVAYSVSQTPTYRANASVGFQDPSRDLGLIGVGVAPTQTAAQLAAANAPRISERGVVDSVRKSLGSNESYGELASSVTAVVDPGSTLVVIRATARTAIDAQRRANAFARASAASANRQARASFRAAVRQIRRIRPDREEPTARSVYDQQLVRLRTLSVIAKPASVADLAQRPSSPTSPRPVRNAFFGAILGLVLGMLAVFARDSLDRRLRTVADVQETLDVPLLGHVRDEAMGRSPNLGGGEVPSENWELFRMVRRNLDFLDTGGSVRTIAVTSAIPEEGKTTVAMFVAFASAAAGKRTLLIECDLRRPTIAARLGISPAPGLTDFVSGEASPPEILQSVSFSDPATGRNGSGPEAGDADSPLPYVHAITCITAGTRTLHPAEILTSERFLTMLSQVQEVYDLVILDTPPLLSVVDALELVPHVGATVLCVRASRTTRDQALAGKAALERLPDRPLGIVVTGTRKDQEPVYGYYGYYA